VREAFADEPRVRLLTLENGGKARALNEGLKLATGEIVIALDADTQFEPVTIAGWRGGSSIPRWARSRAMPRSATG
jgi:glycosyltransferase involved in cell wall biosynthesis